MRVNPLRVLVTRPEPECSRWVNAMQQAGVTAVALPLIEIVSIPFSCEAAPNYDAFLFVSRSAVEGFFKRIDKDALQIKRSMATGLGTRAALMAHGLQSDYIDSPDGHSAQFDSEALWALVSRRDWRGKRALVVRGTNDLGGQEGRSWLADQLVAAGATVDFVATYARRLPLLTESQYSILQKQKVSDIWLFTSSQSIRHLERLTACNDWHTCYAMVTHERIGEAATQAGFGFVHAVRPVLIDVVAAVLSMAQVR